MPSVATVETGLLSAGGGIYNFQPALDTAYILNSLTDTFLDISYGINIRDFTALVEIVGSDVNNNAVGHSIETDSVRSNHNLMFGHASGWNNMGLRIQNVSGSSQRFVLSITNISDVARVIGKAHYVTSGSNSGATFQPPVGKIWARLMYAASGLTNIGWRIVRSSDGLTGALWKHSQDQVGQRLPWILDNSHYMRGEYSDGGSRPFYLIAVELDTAVASVAHLFVPTGGANTTFTPAAGVSWMVMASAAGGTDLMANGVAFRTATRASRVRTVINSSMSIRVGVGDYTTALILPF